MQPVGHSSSNNHLGKCQETGSKCVIWDGPDINCLGVNLCKGQSIEVVMYHTAIKLCEVLDALNISVVDLACLTPPVGTPQPSTGNQLFQLIIDKLCAIQDEVDVLQNTGSTPITVNLPDCDDLLASCPSGITLQYPQDPNDPNSPYVTQLLLIDPVTNTSPAVSYLTEVICELLCRMSSSETAILNLQLEVQQIKNTISSSLPPVTVPPCISPIPTIPLVDPNDSTQGAVPEIANLLCDIYENITGDPNSNYPMETLCGTDTFASLPPLGIYPGQNYTSLAQLGAIAVSPGLAQGLLLKDVINNLVVAICDLRNFAQKVNSDCCPSACLSIYNEASAIGAVIPVAGNRNTVRFFLNGTFLDTVTNSNVTADFGNGFNDFTPPGYAPGGPTLTPPQWDIDKPITVTFTDGVTTWSPAPLYTLQDFATPGFFVDYPVGANGLNTTLNYTVSFTVTVEAPDFTTCVFTNSTVLSTTCDNQPVTNVFMTEVGANGFTVNFTPPIGPIPPTIRTGYIIRIVDTGNPANEFSYPVTDGFTQYLFYPDITSYPGATTPDDTSANWISTSDIEENTTYNVYVQAVYDCGFSSEVAAPLTVTTLIGIEIDISALAEGDNCILSGGTLTLIPTIVPGQQVSANFSLPITFDGQTPVIKTVSCSPGLQFGYSFETMSLNNILWSSGAPTNCNAVNTTRCYGQHSAAYFYPGHTYTTFLNNTPNRNGISGLIKDYDKVGCYDYVISDFGGTGILTTGAPQVTNINDGTGNPYTNTEHGTYQYTYNTPTNLVVTAPLTNNGTFTILNRLHKINNGLSRPVINIKIDDVSSYLQNQDVMWYGTNQGGAAAAQSVEGVQWILGVQNIFIQNGGLPVIGTTIPYKWVGNDPLIGFAGTNGTPAALPVFMRIAHYKWNGSGYINPQIPTNTLNAVNVYDITPHWLSLPNIATTGLNINLASYGININLRDKLVITFGGGVNNPGTNAFYPLIGGGVGAGATVASSVTIEQDPFAGIFPDPPIVTGPFTITGNSPLATGASAISYTNATTGFAVFGAGTFYGVPLNDFAPAGGSGAVVNNYKQPCEFVISGDTTLTWSVG